MAKRRRVGNMLALAVLAVVIERPMHPYEMATVIKERGKDRDMAIKWGSFYTVVANLAKHGLIEAVESGRQGGRPERTTYRITDAGREELADWARELVADPDREPPRFEAALSVILILPPEEATALLAERLARLEAQLARQRESHAHHSAQLPRLFLIENEYDIALLAAEVHWIRGLVDELTSGSLPGLDGWRTYHETGVAPAFPEGGDPPR